MSKDLQIFDGKTFQQLTKDIYDNSSNKKKQLDLLIQEIHGFITSIDDVVILTPILKEIYEVSVKNDEHLVKLASVLQRIITRTTSTEAEDMLGLTESEKQELMLTLKETANEIQLESDKVNKLTSNVKKYKEI